jgi:hypothetical protein
LISVLLLSVLVLVMVMVMVMAVMSFKLVEKEEKGQLSNSNRT